MKQRKFDTEAGNLVLVIYVVLFIFTYLLINGGV